MEVDTILGLDEDDKLNVGFASDSCALWNNQCRRNRLKAAFAGPAFRSSRNELIMSLLLRLADALNQDDVQARRLNIGLAVGMGFAVHAVAIWIGRDMATDSIPWFALPVWANSLVWLFLFALLGAARWMLNSYTIIGVSTARTMVTVLILSSLLWPLYSLPAVDPRITLAANAILVALTVGTIVIVHRRSIEAASLIMPLVVWLAFSIIVNMGSVGWL